MAVATPKKPVTYLGLDGEGQGSDVHRYVFLASATEGSRQTWSVEIDAEDFAKGESLGALPSHVCLDFLLSLPRKGHALYAFALGYDITKWLQDLCNKL